MHFLATAAILLCSLAGRLSVDAAPFDPFNFGSISNAVPQNAPYTAQIKDTQAFGSGTARKCRRLWYGKGPSCGYSQGDGCPDGRVKVRAAQNGNGCEGGDIMGKVIDCEQNGFGSGCYFGGWKILCEQCDN